MTIAEIVGKVEQLTSESAKGVFEMASTKRDRTSLKLTMVGGKSFFAKCFHTLRDSFERELAGLRASQNRGGGDLVAADSGCAIIVTTFLDAKRLSECDKAPLEDIMRLVFARCLDFCPSEAPRSEEHIWSLERYLPFVAKERSSLVEGVNIDQIADELALERFRPCHRDLCPENVLLGELGEVRIIDFEHFGLDNPLIDLARLTFSPTMRLMWSKRIETAQFGVCYLRDNYGGGANMSQFASALQFWAICCAGFYLKHEQERTQEGKDLWEITTAPLYFAQQVRKHFKVRCSPVNYKTENT